MRIFLLTAVLAGALHGAVIRGTVEESFSGRPLSRAAVVLEPVPGSPGTRATAHTNRFGFFEFNEPPGVYLLQASRESYLSSYYGQKRWNSAGKPLTVTESEPIFITFRLLRYASLTGTVLDENDVGIPGFDVAAYSTTFPPTGPPQLAARGVSDDRGRYRIYGLLPGMYVVRSGGKEVDGIGYKPTYGKETDVVEQAHTVDVEIEQQADLNNIHPLPGKLFSLTVSAECVEPPGMPITITLASDLGRQTFKGDSHIFNGLPPGDYEVFAEAPTLDDPPLLQSNYQRISLGKDSVVSFLLKKTPRVSIQAGNPINQSQRDSSTKVLARKIDLAGTYDQRTIAENSAVLAAGRWQFAIAPGGPNYASAFFGSGIYGRNQHPEGWNEAMIYSTGGSIRFTLANATSTLHGLVKDGADPVVGAPVFLEPVEIDEPRRVTENYVAVSDVHGQYKFPGVLPGRYRLLSTFEYQSPDSKTMQAVNAIDVQIDRRGDVTRDLDLYVIR